jgi:polyisoprenoid-binding protein YceI
MARWNFEPGHTSAEFKARHMMVTWVRGFFRNITGSLEFDPSEPGRGSVGGSIDARTLWSGQPDRDAHLRSPDFLDVERFPTIDFRSTRVKVCSPVEYLVTGDLTIRGIRRLVTLEVRYWGQWSTPWWEGGVDKGPVIRAGFEAVTTINRHDFGVSWSSQLDRGGVVVGDDIDITVDVEAILESTDPRLRQP